MQNDNQNEALRAEARSFLAESGVARNAFIPQTSSPGSSAKTDKPVWPCSRETAGAGRKPESTAKRAVLQFLLMLAVALLLLFCFKKPMAGKILLGLSVFVLVCGLFITPVFRAMERFALAFGRWLAVGLTWALLTPFFYLFFIPARIIMTIRGKDPLNLKFNSKAETYWIPRKPVKIPDQYLKQH